MINGQGNDRWTQYVPPADESAHIRNPAAELHEGLPEPDAWFGRSAINVASF